MRSRTQVQWLTKDSILIATAFTGKDVNDYPMEVRLWRRDEPISKAKTVYRGGKESEGVFLDHRFERPEIKNSLPDWILKQTVVAEALKARKLVYLSDVPGLLEDPSDDSTLVHSIKMSEVEGYISKGIIAGGMLPKVLSAVEALKAGTRKVHMIDGRMRHSLLLEIFTDSD